MHPRDHYLIERGQDSVMCMTGSGKQAIVVGQCASCSGHLHGSGSKRNGGHANFYATISTTPSEPVIFHTSPQPLRGWVG